MIKTETIYYKIQHKSLTGEWADSSLDYFGVPPGFEPLPQAYKDEFAYGTTDDIVARNGLKWMRDQKLSKKVFRISKNVIVHKKFPMGW